jgi:hypothetical protein
MGAAKFSLSNDLPIVFYEADPSFALSEVRRSGNAEIRRAPKTESPNANIKMTAITK